MCVVAFDHKPDYQHVHETNEETGGFNKFTGFQPFGLENVKYFSLYGVNTDDAINSETQIAVCASELPPGMLAHAMFPGSSEDKQLETFSTLLSHYAQNHTNDWTIREFMDWIRDTKNEREISEVFYGEMPHETVLGAIKRKIPTRKPKWVDSLDKHQPTAPTGLFAGQKTESVGYFNPFNHVAAGRVLVIRTPETKDGEYGLFVTYMLKRLFYMRQSGRVKFPIICFIDEAQDIFDGGVRQTAIQSVNEFLRKGRSKKLGFVFSVQSADQIPTAILQNLNSRIIHRQNSPEQLRGVIPSAPKELLQTALSFGPGEALVSIFGSSAVVHADMLPSPFKLTKTV